MSTKILLFFLVIWFIIIPFGVYLPLRIIYIELRQCKQMEPVPLNIKNLLPNLLCGTPIVYVCPNGDKITL